MIKTRIKGNSVIMSVIFSLVLCSCNGRDLSIYYNSEAHPLESYETISKDMQPRVIEVIDFKAAQERYLASGYIVIGSMSFFDTRVTQAELSDLAKQKGASIVICVSAQKGTQTRSYTVPHTTNSTSHTSGTISDAYMPGYNTVSYSGTTTTSSTEWRHHQYRVGFYKNDVIFLAKKR